MRVVATAILFVSTTIYAQTPSPASQSARETSKPPESKAGGISVSLAGSDTLYRLAVKPSDHPDEDMVWLLDEGIVRFEPDGRGARSYRQVVQILSDDAAQRYRERQFSYSPGHQKLTINWIRVVKPNGDVISTQPSQMQDSDVPASMGDPVYSDRKIRRASLTGVEPGAIVDVSYTTEELKPYLPGDFTASWAVNTTTRTMRSNYVVDVPESFPINIEERNPHHPRRTVVRNGRKLYIWSASDLAPEKIEPFAAAESSDVFQSIEVGGNITWSDITKWYATNAKDRYEVSPKVAARISELVGGAKTREDSIRAIHRWVAQDIRYVSIALGMGGYQPRSPETVVETGFGDCKDKVTLFVAALGKIGVTAFPVLLESEGHADRRMPSITQLDHAIAAVSYPDGYHFTDLTADLIPYGEIPAPEQGGFAIVVHPDGRAEEVVLPKDPVGATGETVTITGTLGEDGMFNGHYVSTFKGGSAAVIREIFASPLDSTQRADFPRQVARRFYESTDADSLVAFDGKDLSVTPQVSYRIKNAKAAQDAGPTRILTLPLKSMGAMTTIAATLEQQPKRRFPIEVSEVLGDGVGTYNVSIKLPPGWKARLPTSVDARSAFGSYSAQYTQVGNELRMTRSVSGARGVLPPERISELISWLRAVGKDDAKFIVLEKSGA